MSCFLEGLFHVFSFVKSGILHDNNGLGRKLWDQILLHPSCKGVHVNCLLEQTDREQEAAQQSPNDIGSSFGPPVMPSITALTFQGIPMSPRHVMGKAALV